MQKNISEANFIIEIFNADGSTALQCGNGLRCLENLYTRGRWKRRFSASDYKFLAKAVFRRFSVD